MIAGKHDTIVYPVDTQWVRDHLGSALIEYYETNGGHTLFFLGEDMAWVQSHVLRWINEHNSFPKAGWF